MQFRRWLTLDETQNLFAEYAESVVLSLIRKFKTQESGLEDDLIRTYIQRFEAIKNGLPNKDITTYTWKQLENAVDGHRGGERVKAGKLDPEAPDANLLHSQNGIRIYLGRDRKSCIRYGNGYTFCISARGKGGLYDHYRFEKKGTPYFLFNDNLPQDNNQHAIVIFALKPEVRGRGKISAKYTVTLADNKKDEEFWRIDKLLKKYPWAEPIRRFVGDWESDDEEGGDEEGDERRFDRGHVPPNARETAQYYLGKEFDRDWPTTKRGLSDGNLDSLMLGDLLEDGRHEDLKDFMGRDDRSAILVTLHIGKDWPDNSGIGSNFKNYSPPDNFLRRKDLDNAISKSVTHILKSDDEIIKVIKGLVREWFKNNNDPENMGVKSPEEAKRLLADMERDIDAGRQETARNLETVKNPSSSDGRHGAGGEVMLGPKKALLLKKVSAGGRDLLHLFGQDRTDDLWELLKKKRPQFNNAIRYQEEHRKNLSFLAECDDETATRIMDAYNDAPARSRNISAILARFRQDLNRPTGST